MLLDTLTQLTQWLDLFSPHHPADCCSSRKYYCDGFKRVSLQALLCIVKKFRRGIGTLSGSAPMQVRCGVRFALEYCVHFHRGDVPPVHLQFSTLHLKTLSNRVHHRQNASKRYQFLVGAVNLSPRF
jgi:hypothetical protein